MCVCMCVCVCVAQAAMRNIFEKYAGDAFTVSDVHKPDNSFHEEPPPRTADYESDTDTATTDEVSLMNTTYFTS